MHTHTHTCSPVCAHAQLPHSLHPLTLPPTHPLCASRTPCPCSIDKWMTQHHTCPICRVELEPEPAEGAQQQQPQAIGGSANRGARAGNDAVSQVAIDIPPSMPGVRPQKPALAQASICMGLGRQPQGKLGCAPFLLGLVLNRGLHMQPSPPRSAYLPSWPPPGVCLLVPVHHGPHATRAACFEDHMQQGPCAWTTCNKLHALTGPYATRSTRLQDHMQQGALADAHARTCTRLEDHMQQGARAYRTICNKDHMQTHIVTAPSRAMLGTTVAVIGRLCLFAFCTTTTTCLHMGVGVDGGWGGVGVYACVCLCTCLHACAWCVCTCMCVCVCLNPTR